MSVLILTGAGISASAGIPTYRDGGSSWKDADLEKKSHATRYGNHLDELWNKHWGPVYDAMQAAEPTHAHRAIAEFQKAHPETIVATQNIDTLHERAGSDNVAHVHGSMSPYCMKCKGNRIVSWRGNGAPECLDCGARKSRPDVVLFGEMLNSKLMKGLSRFSTQPETTHVIAVGTSLNVFPAATLVLDVVGSMKTTILINKESLPMQKWFTEVHNTEADSVIDIVLENVLNDIRTK